MREIQINLLNRHDMFCALGGTLVISYLYKLDNKYHELGQVDLDRCNSKWDTSEVDKSRHRAVRNITVQ